MTEPITLSALAFGAGMQSTTLALMSLTKDPRLLDVTGKPADLLVFADPGSESVETYDLVSQIEALAVKAGVPFMCTTYSGPRRQWLADSLLRDQSFSTIPAFTRDSGGNRGQLMRACTRDYKIRPIARAIKRHLGVEIMPKGSMVDVWLGISIDEVQRAKKETEIGWQRRVFPLLGMRWRRSDCAVYLAENFDGKVGRSSCVFCPYHSDAEWKRLKSIDGPDWRHAVAVDRGMRNMGGRGGIRLPVYLHRSLQPLDEVDFDGGQLSLWGEECDGICGL